MTIIEPVESRVYRLEDELNRLAGTLVNGMPTLGKATAALWWLGHHRELAWAPENRCTPNQATGGMSERNTAGFVPLTDQVLEIVTGGGLVGNDRLRITTTRVEEDLTSSIMWADPFPVLPMHIYTASIYTLMEPGAETPSRPNSMYLHWYDADDVEIGQYPPAPTPTDGGDIHVSKAAWNLSWVTWHAPENAAFCRVFIVWQNAPGEAFSVDKAMFYNGTDPQAWAFPGAGAFDLAGGLRAHLNMKAGIFNPANFLTVDAVCNHIARRTGADAALALAQIPTPNRAVVG